MTERYKVRVTKDHLVFCCGHFISYETRPDNSQPVFDLGKDSIHGIHGIGVLPYGPKSSSVVSYSN
jgi:hypothetical protein